VCSARQLLRRDRCLRFDSVPRRCVAVCSRSRQTLGGPRHPWSHATPQFQCARVVTIKLRPRDQRPRFLRFA
jgi:hypothetical protein